MKKLFALLLTVVMMASMMVPAMADYGVITPGSVVTIGEDSWQHATTLPHSLTLTRDGETSLDYEITYSYSVDKVVVVGATANGVNTADNAVTGKPTIADIIYNSKDDFSVEQTAHETMVIDWSAVAINEPGIYSWKVTQTFDIDVPEGSPNVPTNGAATFYLFMYVVDDGNGNLVANPWFSKTVDENGLPVDNEKDPTLPEYFPAKTIDLVLNKVVTGNQGSKDQYFQFTITLTNPGTLDKEVTYQIGKAEGDKYSTKTTVNAYHGEFTNPTSVTVAPNPGYNSVTLWLKAGETVTIQDIIYGTSYKIVEEANYNKGYDVDATVAGEDQDGQYTKATYTTEDSSMIGNAEVTYTNHKETTVPTGINLQSGTAFFGLVLAMGMMVLLFVGKRKEQN